MSMPEVEAVYIETQQPRDDLGRMVTNAINHKQTRGFRLMSVHLAHRPYGERAYPSALLIFERAITNAVAPEQELFP